MKNPAQVRRRRQKKQQQSQACRTCRNKTKIQALEIQDGARNSNEGGKMESGPLSLRLG